MQKIVCPQALALWVLPVGLWQAQRSIAMHERVAATPDSGATTTRATRPRATPGCRMQYPRPCSSSRAYSRAPTTVCIVVGPGARDINRSGYPRPLHDPSLGQRLGTAPPDLLWGRGDSEVPTSTRHDRTFTPSMATHRNTA